MLLYQQVLYFGHRKMVCVGARRVQFYGSTLAVSKLNHINGLDQPEVVIQALNREYLFRDRRANLEIRPELKALDGGRRNLASISFIDLPVAASGWAEGKDAAYPRQSRRLYRCDWDQPNLRQPHARRNRR